MAALDLRDLFEICEYVLADLTLRFDWHLNNLANPLSQLILRSGICEVILKSARMFSQILSHSLDLLGWSRSMR